ncbi:HEAT repeat domain-containing protein [Chloroflexota bacterium]
MQLPFEQFMAELRDTDEAVVRSKLANLSELSPEELDIFRSQWPDIDVERRRQVVGQLAELAEENLELDFDDVLRACLADTDTEVRTNAIEGLWDCEELALLDQLIGLLLEDSMPSVRAAAACALRKFALLAELGKISEDDASRVEKALLAAWGNKEEQLEVCRRTLEAISPISKPAVTDLIRQAYNSDNFDLQISALYAMGQNCDPVWLPILLQELRSPHAEKRFEAARACGELEFEEAVPSLIELIADLDPQVRISAIEALGKIGGGSAKEALQRCMASPDEVSQEAAREALGEMLFSEDPFSLNMKDY